ncbi:MOSC domain-containing protein [Pontixanthobacter luteolus]|uniref:MOSC domain-containing protein n=1 Tax=Pontixanthobacter luteolus TaxID=295089 RepID=UPI0023025A77|nr:MOSC domain-containing protein [Pontixanthobacter luteolus]
MEVEVTHLLAGKSRPFRGEEMSAIAKLPLTGPQHITELGLEADEQADTKVHGGPHMAVHLYPLDHNDFWRGEIGDHPLLNDAGAFGSNLAVSGLTEDAVHIGDRFRLGSALLEISQPRQPCWKIEHRFRQKNMVATILKSGRCGWYFRVIEAGTAEAGDALRRVVTGCSDWTVERAFSAIWGNPNAFGDSDIEQLADLKTLTPKLREKMAARIAH